MLIANCTIAALLGRRPKPKAGPQSSNGSRPGIGSNKNPEKLEEKPRKKSPGRPRGTVTRPPEPDYSVLQSLKEGAPFSSFIQSFIKLCCQGNARNEGILSGGLGADGSVPVPCRELSERFDCSPARIGQIEHEVKEQFGKQLSHLIPEIMDIPGFRSCLQKNGGAAEYREAICNVLFHRFSFTKNEWRAAKNFTQFMKKIFPERLSFNDMLEAVYDRDHPCMRCKKATEVIRRVVVAGQGEGWSGSDLSSFILKACGECPERTKIERFSDAFLRLKSAHFVRFENGVFVHRLSRSNSERTWLAEYMKNKGGPVHPQDILIDARQQCSDKKMTRHHLIYLIRGLPVLHMWGDGAYIHEDNIKIPAGQIEKMESAALDLLNRGACSVSAAEIYAKHKEECEASGIPSPFALYTCMRLHSNPKLVYPRYAQIRLPN